MKKSCLGTLVALSALAFSNRGFSHEAAGFETMQVQTKLAYDDFLVAQPAHAEHFTGYKAWISGEDTKVIIYVTHGTMNMQFAYTCHVHEEGPECHRQF